MKWVIAISASWVAKWAIQGLVETIKDPPEPIANHPIDPYVRVGINWGCMSMAAAINDVLFFAKLGEMAYQALTEPQPILDNETLRIFKKRIA